MANQLSKDAWVAAGFASLAENGPKAININVLAKRLGATKGSFYWHFTDLAAYKAAMLELWQTKVATEIISDLNAAPTPKAKLQALTEAVRITPPDEYGGSRIETAMRAWALSDDMVAAALEKLDQVRIGFLRSLLADLGVATPGLAELTYAAYIGLDDLKARGRADAPTGFAILQEMILAAAESD